MTDARPDSQYSFEFVSARLGQAGMTLLALHVAGVKPSGYRSFWPDVAGAEAVDTAIAPSAREISDMDEALAWISLIPASELTLRKLVGARALCRPDRRRGKDVAVPIFSWKVLGERMGCSEVTAKTWWIRGIEMILTRLAQPGLCQQGACRGTRVAADAALRQAGARLQRALQAVEAA